MHVVVPVNRRRARVKEAVMRMMKAQVLCVLRRGFRGDVAPTGRRFGGAWVDDRVHGDRDTVAVVHHERIRAVVRGARALPVARTVTERGGKVAGPRTPRCLRHGHRLWRDGDRARADICV